MKNRNAPKSHITGRILLTTFATALAAAFAVALPQPAYADDVTPPPVPDNLKVEAGNEAFLVGHAVGTQNYVCLPSGTGVAYVLSTPEATLFSDDGKQLTTHFFSPNPFENNTNPAVVAAGMIRATWQHSRDSSTVWAQVKAGNSSTDQRFVARNAIAWLLLTVPTHGDPAHPVLDTENGPTGGDTLTKTTFVQRLNTSGGVAPSTGCSSPTDVGHLAFAPYTADYFFFRHAEVRADDSK